VTELGAKLQEAAGSNGTAPDAGEGSTRASVRVTIWEAGNKFEQEVDPLEHARARLALPSLQRVLQRGTQDAVFDLELEDGRLIPVGTMKDLRLDPDKVTNLIAEFLPPDEPPPPRYTREKWDPIFRCLHALKEVRESETTPDDVTHGWLVRYMNERKTERDLSDPEQLQEVVKGSAITAGGVDPFYYEGRLYIYLNDFEVYVRSQLRRNVTARDLSARLERLGFEAHTLRDPGHLDGEEARRRYKRSAAGFVPGVRG
jgi:hypothetical protein